MTILVLGNVTTDQVFRVRRLAQPGETVLAEAHDLHVGGKGANQAVVASRFGADVRLVAAVGSDRDGQFVRDQLAAEAVDIAGLVTVPAPTDQSVITVDKDGENVIVSSHAAARSLSPDLAAQHASSLTPGDWLALQGNLSQEATLGALREAKRRDASTFFNSAPIQWEVRPLLPFVDLLVLNRPELAALTDTDDPECGGQRLLEAGARQVVVTLGGDGAAIVDGAGFEHLAAEQMKIIDTAGAGDTFCGATITGLAEGADLTMAATLGMRAAAITVTRPGTQPAFPTAAEAGLLKSEVLPGAPG